MAKELCEFADVVMFSRDFVEWCSYKDAASFIKECARTTLKVRDDAIIICGWGSVGAFASEGCGHKSGLACCHVQDRTKSSPIEGLILPLPHHHLHLHHHLHHRLHPHPHPRLHHHLHLQPHLHFHQYHHLSFPLSHWGFTHIFP